ncbi:unnamed protein product [Chironomus riparius]|uniref:Lipase domain-containing protein n=1 Tax=Chironomus riparius TaxID=315576 RepID=A0A9N9RR86_9DIPT|nr:unnamed protein product [Chironomus riparius]
MLVKSLVVILSLIALGSCDSRIRYRFYREATYVDDYTFADFNTILSNPSFSSSRQTVIFHYGAGQTLATPQIHDIITAYAVNRQFNFIVIFYDNLNTISTGEANALAEGITVNLLEIFDRGYNSGLMNLLGFSLGAQIMARASRQVQSRSNRRHIVSRLTGLDPWNLGAISSITVGRLSSSDAQWVESVHTESSNRGDHESRGHIAFFVNGGVAQPMCTQTLPTTRWDCSHVFALSVWAESVRASSPIFPSLSCDSWSQFQAGQCNSNQVANLGRTSFNTAIRGSYFLSTNMQAPWSRNQAQP